jgi:hypothetical protein
MINFMQDQERRDTVKRIKSDPISPWHRRAPSEFKSTNMLPKDLESSLKDAQILLA